MPLHLIGYWKNALDDAYPFPEELARESDPDVRDAAASYLDAGALFKQYRGLSTCRFGCADVGGSRELTDGAWVWPDTLGHYVRAHAITLPPDFVSDARRLRAPATSLDQKADPAHWVDWARTFRLPHVDALVAEAKIAVARTCEAAWYAEGARLAAEMGVGTLECVWAGCGRRALRSKAMCGRCIARKGDPLTELEAERDELRRIAAQLARP
jgi:hypothetical protein